MSDLLGLIRQVDVSIYYFLNGFAGNRALDYICKFGEYSKFFRGGVLTAVYWFFWFQPDARQHRRRRAIVTILAGALLSLIASLFIADVLPFRTRPMYDLHLQHQPYSVPIQPDLVNWSAFPSDQATFFFALAFGMLYLSRWVGFLAMFYAAVWICLPRMFLGVHYASDTVAGAAIGMVNGLAAINAQSGMSEFSGIVLPIVAEVTPAQTKNGGVVVATGKLGEIAKEAVQNVSALIKKYTGEDISRYDMHIQFVGTSDGVEGDSASVSIATAVISASTSDC